MSTGIHYRLGLDAGPLVKGFAMARGAVDSFVNGAGKLGGIVAGLSGLAGAGGALATFAKAITGAAEMETAATSFEVLTGSAERAKATLDQLKAFASETPFEFPEIAEAGKKLLAFGSGAGAIAGELRMLGDLSAGIGAPLGDLAELYGKARVQGRLFAEDVNQLTGRGIPVIQEFAKQFNVSTSEVKALVEAGQIGFPELRTALRALTAESGKFFEMTKRQSQTAAGLWSTLKDSVNEVLREFGAPILGELKVFLKDGIAAAGGLIEKARAFGKEVATATGVFGELMKRGQLGEAIGAGLKVAFAGAINLLISGLAMAAKGFASALASGVQAIWEGGNAGEAAGRAFSGAVSLFDVDKAKADFMRIVAPSLIAVKLRQAMEQASVPLGPPAPLADLGNEADATTPPNKKRERRQSNADALARIGLYVGGGGPSAERYARETAQSTKQATGLLGEINRKMDRNKGGTF